jgi:predicted nucleic acid-binding protein
VVDQVGVVHGGRIDDLLDRSALEQAFDRDLQLLPGAGVRDGRHLDDLVGDVAGPGAGADGFTDAVAQGVVRFGTGREDHEQRHPVASVRLLRADDQGFGDLGEALDDVVDVGAAEAYAVAIEGGVGAAVHDHRAVGGEGDPVAVPPHTGISGEVRLAVAGTVGVVPEGQRHGRHGAGDDQFADLVDDRMALLVVRGQCDAQVGRGELARPHRHDGRSAGEAGDDVGAAADGGELDAVADVVTDPGVGGGGRAEPVQPTARIADRSWTVGSMPNLAMPSRY